MYLTWRYSGTDPYRLFNGPDVGPPVWPSRQQAFAYACGEFAQEEEYQKVKAIAGTGQRRAVEG